MLGPGQGWNSPASPHSGVGQVFWLVALLFVGISSMMGSINYVTTIINLRAPGMTLFRMPLSVWSLFITAILQAMALPVLTVALILQLLDKTINTTFFLPPGGLDFGNLHTAAGGGQPLLWQHVFWFYSHPAVYIMILPAMGMVSDVIATFSRKPHLRLSADGLRARRHRRAGLHRLGPSHVPERHGPAPRHRLHAGHHHDRPAVGRQSLQLAGHRLGR